MHLIRLLPFLLLVQLPALAADPDAQQRGRAAIERHGCAVCHVIPGIASPGGNIGPSLARLATRSYLAGTLPNTPANLQRWLRDPTGVKPGTAMPDTGLSPQEAQDIAAYLYTR